MTITATEAHQLDKQTVSQTVKRVVQVHDWSKIQGLYLIGSFADPHKEIHEQSDIDVLVLWKSTEAYIENQNQYEDGIRGRDLNANRQNNEKVRTANFGIRPLDIIEENPLTGNKVASEAKIPLPF